MQSQKQFLNNYAPWLIGGLLLSYIVLGIFLKQETKVPVPVSVILKPVPTAAGPKRYVIWNKTASRRGAPGAKSMDVASFASLGARNIKQMELINGATFEAAEEAVTQIRSLTVQGGNEWVIQPEYEHGILSWSCSRCETLPCPGPTPDPGPTPSPDPQPVPGPAPEPSKSWGRDRVHAPGAMALIDTANVKVCVIDTGIDLQHPNNGVILGKQDFSGKGSVQDGAGHGTHTAGTISGTRGVGISRAKLLICKGLTDNGSGTSSALAQCLAWCGSQGAQIVSNSWGSPQSDPLINNQISALTQKGIYVFVAAGNDSGPVNWPARLAGSNNLVYAIAASNQADQITSFSSRGVEIRAISPGAGIVSNWPGGGTRALDGTSMAAPHAAGICAFGIARGRRPCIAVSGTVSGYPFADARASAQ